MINNKKTFTKLTGFINMFSWIIALISLGIVSQAKPPFETFVNRMKDMNLRKTWDTGLMEIALYCFIAVFILSIFSIIINIFAYKKEMCEFKFSPIFLSVCSSIAIIIYLIHF